MELKIYRQDGTLKATVSPSSNSSWNKEVMADNVLNLSFTHYEYIRLNVNDYVNFQEECFKLLKDYCPVKKSSIEYQYDVKFYGVESELKKAIVLKMIDGDNDTSFSLTDNPASHLQLIVDNINRIKGTNIWKKGQVIGAPNKDITYDSTFCFDALQKIAETFDTEWWIEGTTIHLTRCEQGDLLELGYDKGLKDISKDGNDNAPFFTRLYPIGSTRNIDRTVYGSSRLHLPGGAQFVEQNISLGIVEYSEENAFKDIYPKRIGTVGIVRSVEKKGEDGKPFTVYYFTDPELNFNPGDYEIAGLVKSIVFQSGELNGYDFEVNWHNDTKEFEITNKYPYSNQQLPGGMMIPATGNEYILYNIKMPEVYYAQAEEELAVAVADYLKKYSIDTAIYKTSSDYIHFEEHKIDLKIGQRIRLCSDEYFNTGYRDSRVISISRKVNSPQEMEIGCSLATSVGRISKIENSLSELQAVYRQKSSSTLEIIESNDLTPETDQNVYSAARAKLEDEKRLRKDVPDLAREHITFAKGLTVTGGATVDSLKVTGLAEAKTLNVTETATTMDLIVKNLAETYDLNVSHVATLFRTIIKDYISSELFIPGFTGSGTKLYQALNGDWNLELDNLTVRKVMNVFELIINKIRSVNGAMVISQSNGKVESVTNLGEFYQLGINEEYPTFQPGDLVRCQRFTGRGIKYYWVTVSRLEGSDIVVAKSEFDSLPEIGDELVQMGNVSNPNRQSLIYLSAAEDGRPVIDILNGVNSKSFAGKLMSRFGCLDNITDTDFPSDYQPSGYGLYSVNCFLKGIFVLRNGKTVEGALTELGSMYSSLQTELSAVSGQITLAIRESKEYTNSSINDIQIGGRNFYINSSTPVKCFAGATFNYKQENGFVVTGPPNGNGICRIYNVLDGNGWWTISGYIKGNLASRVSFDFADRYAGEIRFGLEYSYFQLSKYVDNYSADTYQFIDIEPIPYIVLSLKDIKIEQGNKATSWTLAPEDIKVDAQIRADAAANVVRQETESKIDIINGQIGAKVSQTDFNALGQRVSTSESGIQINKEAIALKASQIALDGLGNRLTDAEAKIQVSADSILQTVTKTEFNNLQIGGRNYFRKNSPIFDVLNKGRVLSHDENGFTIISNSNGEACVFRINEVLLDGGNYTVSGCIASNVDSFNVSFDNDYQRHDVAVTLFKTPFQLHFNNDWSHSKGYTFLDLNVSPYVYIYITDFKIEKGNKATSWMPAPEDVSADAQVKADAAKNAAISDAAGKYTTLTVYQSTIEQLDRSISLKASQTTVDGINERLSAAEIKVQPNQINLIVKNQIDTATNNIQVGGRNFYINSSTPVECFAGATFNYKQENGFVVTGPPNGNGICRIYNVLDGNGWWTISGYIKGNLASKVSFDFADRYAGEISFGLEYSYFQLSKYVDNYSDDTYEFIDIEPIPYIVLFLKDIKIEQGNKATSWTLAPKDVEVDAQTRADAAKEEVTQKLLDTGIDISSHQIVMTADNTKIQDNSGNQIALFTTIGGKPKLIAENIDVANLGVKKLDAATGSFKRLNCVDDNGNIVGGVSFGTDGKMWFEGDLYSQGYDYSKDRGFRFYSSDIWCRGGLGSNYHNTLITYGNTGYFCTRGIRTDRKGYVYTVFSSSVDSAGNTYYKLPLLGTSGDAAGFPVDLVVMASGGARYELEGSPGKSIIVANANDRSTVWIYTNGYHIQVDGGAVAQFVNVGSWLLTPAVASNIIGKGWLYYGLTDNNWS